MTVGGAVLRITANLTAVRIRFEIAKVDEKGSKKTAIALSLCTVFKFSHHSAHTASLKCPVIANNIP